LKSPPFTGTLVLLGLLLFLAPLAAFPAAGQDVGPGVKAGYFRAVAEHFHVPIEEVTIVADWDVEADEVPVILFLAQRAGVSTDALIGLRRTGRPWSEVASRLGLGVGAFHIPLPENEDLGSLARVYGEFRGRPSRDWNQIELRDLEVIALVNLRVLSEQVGVAPLRVLRCREEAGSFVAGFAILGQPNIAG
jgi:hypothetical protein